MLQGLGNQLLNLRSGLYLVSPTTRSAGNDGHCLKKRVGPDSGDGILHESFLQLRGWICAPPLNPDHVLKVRLLPALHSISGNALQFQLFPGILESLVSRERKIAR